MAVVEKGLLVAKNVKDIADEEYSAPEFDEEYISQLSVHIRQAWQRNRRYKGNIQDRLLHCLRARKGEYSDEEHRKILDQGGADPIYLKLTGTKCRAASSWVRDILLPSSGDWPFATEATTLPDLPDELEASIADSAAQSAMAMAGELTPDQFPAFVEKVRANVQDSLNRHANVAASDMELRIKDKMEEGGWRVAFEEFIEDLATYPAAFIKGPYFVKEKTLVWEGTKPKAKEEVKMAWRRVSPFDIYPSPDARTVQDGELIEDIDYTRGQIYSMLGMDGYNDAAIRAVLEDYDVGHLHNWAWEDAEREFLENNSYYINTETNKIDALHYWGSVKGTMLLEWGIDESEIDDPLAQYDIDAILIGNHVIRAVINDNPLGHRPYHSACWDRTPGSLWGVALPEQMDDHQRMVNATARSLATNLAVSSGPQAIVLTDLMAQGEDITSIYPMKIWQMKTSPIAGNAGRPVDFFQPNSNANVLLEVLNYFKNEADDVTNVPRYSYGGEAGGAGETYRGLNLLMNSAAKGIRRAISDVDSGVIKPSVSQTFMYEMMDSDTPVFGDIKVVPVGSAAMLIREQQQENKRVFLQSITNDMDAQIVPMSGREYLIKEIAKDMGLDVNKLFPEGSAEQRQIEQQVQEMQAQLAQQKDELIKQEDALRAKDREVLERQRRVLEREMGAEKTSLMEQLGQEKMSLEQERLNLNKSLASIAVKEEQLKVTTAVSQLEKDKAQVVYDKARFEHLSGDFERRISAAESATNMAKTQRVTDKFIAKVDEIMAAEKAKQMAAVEDDMDMDMEEDQEPVEDKLSQLKQEFQNELAQVVAALSQPRTSTVERDEQGRMSGVTTTVGG